MRYKIFTKINDLAIMTVHFNNSILTFNEIMGVSHSLHKKKKICLVNVNEFTGNSTFQKQPPEGFMKNSVNKIFAKFTEKHLYQSLLFNAFYEKTDSGTDVFL